jgi:RNA polymerase sigma-70 factor, ECF subfamily
LQPTPPSLIAPFVAAAPPALRRALTAVPALERRLWSFVSEGRSAWPELRLEPTTFIAFVGRRLQHDEEGSDAVEAEAEDALDGLRAADLYLACACAGGDPAAVMLFENRYMGEVAIALSRMRLSASQVDEVKQLVRQRLFVAGAGQIKAAAAAAPAVSGHPAVSGKISEYSGRGDLRRWVRTVALRTCLNLLRKGKGEVLVGDEQVLANLATAGDDPELAYMKQRYRGDFKQAFVDTLAALPARDQTLLRYHHVDSLNIDEIGAIYRVHRVTAYRWLEKAREALVTGIQQRLKERLRLNQGELDSVLRLIRSQLHLSLVRHLGDGSGGEEEIVELDAADVEALDDDDGEDAEPGV